MLVVQKPGDLAYLHTREPLTSFPDGPGHHPAGSCYRSRTWAQV